MSDLFVLWLAIEGQIPWWIVIAPVVLTIGGFILSAIVDNWY